MAWNYRIVEHNDAAGIWYAIHEAFYNRNKGIWAISKEPIHPYGEEPDELREDYELMSQAFKRPIIKYERKFAKSPDELDRVARRKNT
jgi:hypothetical protein